MTIIVFIVRVIITPGEYSCKIALGVIV